MRASYVYSLVVLGFFVLLILSNRPSSKAPRPHRRLIIRTFNHSKFNHSTGKDPQQVHHHENVAFDPIIMEMERKREYREWEREYFREQYENWNAQNVTSDHHVEHEDAPGHEHPPVPWESEHYSEHYSDPEEEYINNVDHFNISHRLEILFPLLDVNPKDGFVSRGELEDWNIQQAKKLSKERADTEFEVRDTNRDGLMTLREYLPHLSEEEINNNSSDGHASWWKAHFNLADADGDGGLNREEFQDFLHPEDSSNPKLRAWLRQEQIKDNDHNKDGKLDHEEFESLFEMLKYNGLEDLHHGNDDEMRKQTFIDLDKNKDGFITEDELEPIMDKLHPGETVYARKHADTLIQQADEDNDGRLSLREMLDNPYVFYSTAYSGTSYDEYDGHDEFR